MKIKKYLKDDNTFINIVERIFFVEDMFQKEPSDG